MQEKQQALGELDGKVQRTLTTAREYKLSEYTSRVIADFVPNFVAMATGLVVVEFFWRQLIARSRKPPARRKHLIDISYTSRIIDDFVPNFVAMATGLVVVEFVWRHSIARPRKPLLYAKISGISLI